jgi:hypothetical protein
MLNGLELEADGPSPTVRYDVLVRAEDGVHSTDVNLMISVSPVNAHPPVFSPAQITLTESEDLTVGSLVGVFSASDADSFPHNILHHTLSQGSVSHN